MRVLVLAGGLSHEREVSVKSGSRVADALKHAGHEVELRDADASLIAHINSDKPDVVVPLLHGVAGEDGTLREVLKVLGVQFVGATPSACRLAFDKPIAKTVVANAGLNVAPAITLPHSTFRELGADAVMSAVVQHLGLPVVVKPTKGGSSLGVTVVRDERHLAGALVSAYAYGEMAMIEKFIEGIEIAVSVIDDGSSITVLPEVEIKPDGGLYDYNARYVAGLTEFFCPANISDEVRKAVSLAALTAHEALGLRDLSRTDLLVDTAGVVWFLEVNVAPGMTETSLFPQSVVAAGMDLGEVFVALINAAQKRGVK
jgi:D-alanine-D-alanine ligase